MKTPLRYLLAAACLFTGMRAFAADEPKAEPSADEAKAITVAWLKLIDDEKYEESWKETASAFQARVTAQVWSEKLTQMRRPLGRTETREFKDANFARELPRLPKGEYWQVRYATLIEGTSVIEAVTLVLDKDGKWHVLSYSIKPPQ